MENKTVLGLEFEWISDGNGYSNTGFYQCKGRIMFDDEHDEIPDPIVVNAAEELAKRLCKIPGIESEVDYSEKGWVEVHVTENRSVILKKNK